MKKWFAAALAALFLVCAHADAGKDSFKTIDEARSMVERVLSDYVKKDQAEALRSLPRFAQSKTDEEQRVSVQKYVAWNATSSEKRGATLGYKFESSKTVAETVMRLRFVVLCERLPVVWDFYFYRTGLDKDWQLAELRGGSGAINLFDAGDR